MIVSRAAAFLIVLAASTAAPAQINFDQLTACDDLARAQASLRSTPGGCRRPATSIERAMVARLAGQPGFSTCWLQAPPSASLARFQCLRLSRSDGVRSLDCIAPAGRADVDDYHQNYETRYARTAADYTRAASSCGIGNGNATRAVRTLLSPMIGMVARFDLGWVLPVGRGQVGESTIVHGYASVDPDLVGDGIEIEFVSFWSQR